MSSGLSEGRNWRLGGTEQRGARGAEARAAADWAHALWLGPIKSSTAQLGGATPPPAIEQSPKLRGRPSLEK